MPDLTSCYFCGTAEAAEAGPAVPPSLDPPEAVQQSVILCPACREKLTAVLDPVFEAGVGGAERSEATADGPAPRTESAPDGRPARDGADGADSETEDASDGITIDRVPGPDEAADAGGSDESTATSAGESGDGDGAVADDPPEEYYTVLRFLENRDFPVERAEVATVVAGAYDLGEREVGEILDAAVRRGVLVEVDGTLARSREQL
jgi:hypothetical protein